MESAKALDKGGAAPISHTHHLYLVMYKVLHSMN